MLNKWVAAVVNILDKPRSEADWPRETERETAGSTGPGREDAGTPLTGLLCLW